MLREHDSFVAPSCPSTITAPVQRQHCGNGASSGLRRVHMELHKRRRETKGRWICLNSQTAQVAWALTG